MSEVEAVRDGGVIQESRLTRCYECLPRVTARVEADRVRSLMY